MQSNPGNAESQPHGGYYNADPQTHGGQSGYAIPAEDGSGIIYVSKHLLGKSARVCEREREKEGGETSCFKRGPRAWRRARAQLFGVRCEHELITDAHVMLPPPLPSPCIVRLCQWTRYTRKTSGGAEMAYSVLKTRRTMMAQRGRKHGLATVCRQSRGQMASAIRCMAHPSPGARLQAAAPLPRQPSEIPETQQRAHKIIPQPMLGMLAQLSA